MKAEPKALLLSELLSWNSRGRRLRVYDVNRQARLSLKGLVIWEVVPTLFRNGGGRVTVRVCLQNVVRIVRKSAYCVL